MDFGIEYEVISTFTRGNSHYRLLKTPKNNKKIQLWSSLSKVWRDTTKGENVGKQWEKITKI